VIHLITLPDVVLSDTPKPVLYIVNQNTHCNTAYTPNIKDS